MSIWTAVLLAAVGSLLFRVTFLVALRNVELPKWAQRATDLILPVAIAAILGSAIHHTAVAQPIGDLIALAAASVVTVLIVRKTGSLLAAVASGLVVVTLTSLFS